MGTYEADIRKIWSIWCWRK